MERLGSLFWSSVTAMALLGMLSSIAAPVVLASPIVRINEPAHGQVVQGQIVIEVAYRTDSDQPITRIDLIIDDELVRQYALATPRLQGSQSFQWDFSSRPGGTYTIGARAVDQSGAIGSATISVRVVSAQTGPPDAADRIPPVINIYYPAQGATVSGTVEIKADASDNVGVKYVFFYINGKLHKIIMNAPPYVDRWDTTNVPDGTYVLQAKAMDAAENAGTSAEVTVFVQNRDMTLSAPESLAQQTPAAAPPALEQAPVAPPVGSAPPVTERDFNVLHEEPTLMAATAEVEARRAEVGYVSAIRDGDARARTSMPRQLSALPSGETSTVPPQSFALDETFVQQAQVAEEAALHETMLAATDYGPRMTMPRRLPELGRHTITPMPEGIGLRQPIEPSLASIDGVQRMTRPRTEVSALPATDATVAMLPGRVVIEPAMQLRPEPEMASAARITTPVRSLMPAETLAIDYATLNALVLDAEPMTQTGAIVAHLEARTTMPSRALSAEAAFETDAQFASAAARIDAELAMDAPLAAVIEGSEPAVRTTLPIYTPVILDRAARLDLGGMQRATLQIDDSFAALQDLSQRTTRPALPDTKPVESVQVRDDRVQGMRIAVLPERASRTLIPADGRITRPEEPSIAPIAASAFTDIEVIFNNKTLDLLAAPEMKEGISLAPLREIFESSDGVLYWFPIEKKVRATRPGTDLHLTIGDPEVTLNDTRQVLQIAPYIKNGRTMVPLQFLADTLDVTVTFNPETGQIAITSNEF